MLAVASEIKRLQPDAVLIYVGQKGDNLGDVATSHQSIDKSYAVNAGKLRRYHGAGIGQLFDIKTHLLNVRDVFKTIGGVIDSYRLLKRQKPDVVFIKGGFVGVPVGLAAAWLKIPYITHDSDVLPGLANRIVARWAAVHAVALPKEAYRYPADKTVTVGVPIAAGYQEVDAAAQAEAKQRIGIAPDRQVVLVVGGGLGARRLNDAVTAVLPDLLHRYPELHVVHGVGRANETEAKQRYNTLLTPSELERITVLGYATNMVEYSAAADVVITRAGGTFLAEFAAQAKACIVVPNPYLTGGHQLQNAHLLEQQGAVKVVPEELLPPQSDELYKAVSSLLDDAGLRRSLGQALHKNAVTNSAERLAALLVKQVTDKPH